jgi:NADH:ubiquinone oxidoreductase subunit H
MKYTIYSNNNKKLKMLSIISILEGLLLIVPALLSVAFVTIAERKTMASMQRRLGPNAVGYYGLLQAFADALKLLLKEYVAPTQANIIFLRSNDNFNICFIRLFSSSLWFRSICIRL